ncbi:MAG: acyl-CoA dehydrogenase [Betaproteobacteria bacterium]|nr:acyl-CoA dehydrogenase [Betaproteobacteria bacterium]
MPNAPFIQAPPQLGNQFNADRVLRAYLSRTLPPQVLTEIEPTLTRMGELAGGELYQLQLVDRLNEPVHTPFDAWGNRIDRIDLTPLWQKAARIAAEEGLIATAYERRHREFSRVHQFSLVYLFTPSSDFYSCPLAMTDGAAKSLVVSGNEPLIARALPRLTNRDPSLAWTSGQWMTEAVGGSDVGLTETIARNETGAWRLYGRKWFTSAITSQMALTLARPVGNPPGGRGLALFYVETRDADRKPNHIVVNRLKDKLGTRKIPTAELELEGTPAQLVYGTTDGVRNIAPMLNVTRTWNAVTSVALMRRGLALARDYAKRRVAFGAPLIEKPLHADTLAGMQAEYEGAFHLAFFVVELLGRSEAGNAGAEQQELLRVLTPIAKLTTGKQVVAVLSEVIECFGGAGYVEDTGLPQLLRDAQVLPIWEGTTNVLALDTLRALHDTAGMALLQREVGYIQQGVREPVLLRLTAQVERVLEQAAEWLNGAMQSGANATEAGARRFALTVGRALELALLLRQAQWSLEHEQDARATAAARLFAAQGVNVLAEMRLDDASILARDA